MMADLLPGRLDAAVMSPVLARPYLLDKRLKGLAINSAERWSVIPDVPTLARAGTARRDRRRLVRRRSDARHAAGDRAEAAGSVHTAARDPT